MMGMHLGGPNSADQTRRITILTDGILPTTVSDYRCTDSSIELTALFDIWSKLRKYIAGKSAKWFKRTIQYVQQKKRRRFDGIQKERDHAGEKENQDESEEEDIQEKEKEGENTREDEEKSQDEKP